MADPTKTELSLDTGSTSVSSGARAVAPLSPEPPVPLPQAKRLNNDSNASTFITIFLSITNSLKQQSRIYRVHALHLLEVFAI